MRDIVIGTRRLGPGSPCLIAAEVGINHNGDMALAHRLIDEAADTGADAVKFQNYRTEDFLSDRSLSYEYLSQGQTIVESQFDMFKRCELPARALEDLRKHCVDRGLVFFGTPTSADGVDELARLGTALLKNGSDFLVNLPLIRSMARSGLATVLSTGMATLAEIDDAVNAFREAGGTDLVLLHCTSSYPTPPADVNLRRIGSLRSTFNCPVGLSDHSEGTVAAVGAVSLGACMLEKHFTLDKNLPGPDHRFSADPREFRVLVDSVRTVEACLGDPDIRPTPSEAMGRRGFRLSCVAARDLSAGHTIREIDVAFRRPADGLPPRTLDWLVGRTLVRSIKTGHQLSLDDFGAALNHE